MKKCLSSLILCSLLVSSCSYGNETKEPPIISDEITETSTAEKTPSFSQAEAIAFTAPDGGALSLEDATGVSYNCAYISYTAQDRSEAEIIKVKAGDKLDNGLKVRTAYSDFQRGDNGYSLVASWADFEGTLTLTGTLETATSLEGTEGELFLYPEAVNIPCQLSNTPRYYLGNINYDEALAEMVGGIISGDEKVRVEAVIQNISVNTSYATSGKNDTADLISAYSASSSENIAEEPLRTWLEEFFDEYYSAVNGIEFNVILDDNGNYIFLDDSEEYPFYELVECNYTISEIEAMLESMLTGKMLESALGSVSYTLKEQDGKMYRYQAEMFNFIYDWHTVFPETYSVVEQTENSLTVTMEAWDNNYEQKKNATAVFELDNEVWKLASISYI